LVQTELTFDATYFETAYRNYAAQNPDRKLGFYRSLLDPTGGRILDLGCAFGGFLRGLGAQWDRYGLDVSAYALRNAAGKITVASAETQPFNGEWDAITAFDCLEHVPDLDAVARHFTQLKPSAQFVMVVPVYDGPLGWLVRLLDRDETHIHKRSRQWWLDWVGQHLQVESWQGIFRYLVGGYYIHWPTRWFRFAAPAIVVVARKVA
jgi:SAM-dependent methyltransferase